MSEGLDHVGVAVKNLDVAIGLWRDVLGMKLEAVHTAKERQLKIAFLSAGGETRLELLEPTGEGSLVSDFIEKHGEGIHHIAIKVRNLEQALNQLRAKGVKMLDPAPRVGVGGVRIAFARLTEEGNVLVELRETK